LIGVPGICLKLMLVQQTSDMSSGTWCRPGQSRRTIPDRIERTEVDVSTTKNCYQPAYMLSAGRFPLKCATFWHKLRVSWITFWNPYTPFSCRYTFFFWL
jgi:hypothetical protein